MVLSYAKYIVQQWLCNMWTKKQCPWEDSHECGRNYGASRVDCEHKVEDVLRCANGAMMVCNGVLKWWWGSEGEVRRITWQGLLRPMEDTVNREGEQVNERLGHHQRQGEVEGNSQWSVASKSERVNHNRINKQMNNWWHCKWCNDDICSQEKKRNRNRMEQSVCM